MTTPDNFTWNEATTSVMTRDDGTTTAPASAVPTADGTGVVAESDITTAADIYDDTTLQDNTTSSFWEEIPFAHEYWHQFDIEGIPAEYYHGVAIWMTFFGIIGVLGNFLVIYTFMRTKHLRTPPNMLIVNLAFGDMAFSAINGFPLLTIAAINRIWKWGDICCQLYGYAGAVFGFLSINTLAGIAMDRYRIVSKPLQAASTMSKKKTARYIVLIWLWSLVWSTPPLLGWGRYLPEGFHCSCTFDYLTQNINNATFIIAMYVGNYVVPVGITVYCYAGIVRSLAKQHKELQKTADRMGATTTKAEMHRKQEIQVAKVSAISVASFLLSWTPYATVALLGMVYPHEDKMVTPYMAEIPVMFAKASASYNPIIYAISHPAYRAEINRRFPWLLCCCKPEPKAHAYKGSFSNDSHTSSFRTHSISEAPSAIAMTAGATSPSDANKAQ